MLQVVNSDMRFVDFAEEYKASKSYLRLKNSLSDINDHRQNIEMDSRRKIDQSNYQLRLERETQVREFENSQTIFKHRIAESCKTAEHVREMEKLKLEFQIEQERRR